MTRSDVSVVIPARDAARYLPEALASVLAQTVPPRETVVVDDGSTDETAAIARSAGDEVRLVSRDPGPGNVGTARNLGVRCSEGAVLAFLDADDRWEPGWLALATAALDADPPPDLVFGGLKEFVSPDLDPADAKRLRPLRGLRAALCASGTVVTRRAYERIGEFNSANPGAEYTDWFMRARDMGMAEHVVGELTVSRRLHERNETRVRRELLPDHAVAIKASLDRRRARGAL